MIRISDLEVIKQALLTDIKSAIVIEEGKKRAEGLFNQYFGIENAE